MNKVGIGFIITLILGSVTYIAIRGSQKTCEEGNLLGDYCVIEETLYKAAECPSGFQLNVSNHTCYGVINNRYVQQSSSCPVGYHKNIIPHLHIGYYECCEKRNVEREKAKTRFYYWFNE